MFESFLQDIRIAFRVLIKEKSFCFLAVLVLALGICGVTTQFTVVNALVLRGFSFPHPEQLMSVGLIDPQASEQNNNFGIGNIPSSQDYEDMRAAQQSFALMAGYLNGSTINVSYRGNPQRYAGAYVTEDFFKIIAVSPVLGRDFTAEDNKPGAEKVAILGHKIWQRDFGSDPKIVGQAIRINGRSATIIGVMPPSFEFPNNEELWVPLYNEFPVKPRGDPNAVGPQVMGRFKARHKYRSSERRVCRAGETNGGGKSEDEQAIGFGQCSAAPQCLHRSATTPDGYRHAGCGPGGFADRVRQRDEHAIRPRGIARKGNGHTRRTRCHPLEAGAANVD